MLKKIGQTDKNDPFGEGVEVFIVTRTGEILEGYTITQRLFDLVSLDRSPLDGGERQGFTVEGDLLRPNWCAGKRDLIAAVTSRERASELAEKQLSKRTKHRK